MISGLPNIPGTFWKNSNVDLNTSTILSKSFVWCTWLCPECSSAGGFNTFFKIQAQRYLTASKDVIILKFRSVIRLSMSRPSKQLSSICAVSLSKIFIWAFCSTWLPKYLWRSLKLINFMLSAYSFEDQGYLFLRMFKNYTDRKISRFLHCTLQFPENLWRHSIFSN